MAKSAAWYRAIKKANSRPRTPREKARLRKLRLGKFPSSETKRKMSASHRKRFAALSSRACSMCGSLKHTLEQHKERAAAARVKSATWRNAVVATNTEMRLGKSPSVRTRKKMSQAQRVVQNSPEQLALRTLLAGTAMVDGVSRFASAG